MATFTGLVSGYHHGNKKSCEHGMAPDECDACRLEEIERELERCERELGEMGDDDPCGN